MATIRFGSNTFSAGDHFTVVGVTEEGGLGLGMFGAPPPTRLVWLSIRNDRVYLNADVADADGELVLSIRDNVITFNSENIYSVRALPSESDSANQSSSAESLRRNGA